MVFCEPGRDGVNQVLQKTQQKIVHTLLHNIHVHVHYTHTVQCSRNQHKER